MLIALPLPFLVFHEKFGLNQPAISKPDLIFCVISPIILGHFTQPSFRKSYNFPNQKHNYLILYGLQR
jgi:hypothetical protein